LIKNIIHKCKAYGITFGMQSKGNEISKNKISGCKSGKIGIAKDSNVTYVK
jgi:parallel beta-helix repeat protein